MTPKEKAKELYCKYADALNIRDLQTTANPLAMFMKKFKEEKSQWSFYHTLRDLRNKNKIIKNKRFYRIA